jgi:acyl-CoA synthetase (AMP-forming)/AMP-acid ligase II
MPEFARLLAIERPEQIALRDGHHALGWATTGDVLDRVANRLLDTDLGPRRRVAVFAENANETALAHLGGLLGGTSTVPVNFHLTAAETAYIFSDSASAIVFVGPQTVDRALEAVDLVVAAGDPRPTIVGWGCNGRDGVVDWAEWVAGGRPGDPPMSTVPLPNLLYTSGTTGLPKGTELPPTMFAGGATMVEHLEALRLNRFAAYGTHLVLGPMYHTGPLSGMRLLVAGIPSVILERFDPERALQAITTYRTESAVMVPTHFVRMLALSDEVKAKYDVSSMRLVAHTGAKCPIDVKRAMIEWWGPVFTDAYGATEVGTTCSITSQEWLENPGSVGRAIPPFTVEIYDDSDVQVGPNVEGRLFFRDATGRGIVYPNDSAKTAAAHIAPGVFTLGEIGYVNDAGYVFITDRFSDMVVSGGVNIYPAEAEQVLVQHPGVADVGCIGVPNREMGEELRALVVPTDPSAPPDPAELVAFCRERLSHYKCPRTVEIVADLGRNSMGKVNKRALRRPYWEGVE